MNFTPLASPPTGFFFEAVLPSVTLEKNDLENHAELGQTGKLALTSHWVVMATLFYFLLTFWGAACVRGHALRFWAKDQIFM